MKGKFREVLLVVLRHWWVVLLTVAAVLGTNWYLSKEDVDVYQTTGTIEIMPSPSWAPLEGSAELRGTTYNEFRTQMELLKLDEATDATIEALLKDPDDLEAAKELGEPGAGGKEDRARLSEALRGRLAVDQRASTHLVDIRMTGFSPQRIAKIVAVHLQEFRGVNDRRLRGKLSMRLEELEKERVVLEADRTKKRETLDEIKKANPSVYFDEPDLSVRQRLDELKNLRSQRRLEIKFQEALLARISTFGSDEAELRKLYLVANDAELKSLEEDRRTLDKTLNKAREEGLGEFHGTIVGAKENLAANTERQSKRVRQIVEVEQMTALILVEKLAILEKLIEEEEKEWIALKKVLDEYAGKNRDLQDVEDLYVRNTKEKDALKVPQQSPYDPIRIVALPKPPTIALPRAKTGYIFATAIALLAGIGLAYLLDYVEDTVKTPDDVETKLGMVFLGSMPYIPVEADDFIRRCTITQWDSKSTTSEAFRAIRTSLLFVGERAGITEPRGWNLLVSSCGQSEGKTTTVVNLAITLAHSGSRVLLVDADLRRPNVHRAFELENDIGLTNILAQGQEMEEVVRPSGIKNVSILTSGPRPPNPYELLAAPSMQAFLDLVRQKYDFVLFDTPPLLPVSDAALLAGKLDGSILVVSAGRSHRRLVQRGKELLERSSKRCLGVILNYIFQSRYNYYYYYYYYRGLYRYYYRYMYEGYREGIEDEDKTKTPTGAAGG